MASMAEFGQYHSSVHDLRVLIDALKYADRAPEACRRHAHAANIVLSETGDRVGTTEELQQARNHLLIVRELMGDCYDDLPTPDRLIRLCDTALAGITGKGKQSQMPYEDSYELSRD